MKSCALATKPAWPKNASAQCRDAYAHDRFIRRLDIKEHGFVSTELNRHAAACDLTGVAAENGETGAIADENRLRFTRAQLQVRKIAPGMQHGYETGASQQEGKAEAEAEVVID